MGQAREWGLVGFGVERAPAYKILRSLSDSPAWLHTRIHGVCKDLCAAPRPTTSEISVRGGGWDRKDPALVLPKLRVIRLYSQGLPNFAHPISGCPSKCTTSCFHRPGEGAEILYLCQAPDSAHAARGGGVLGAGAGAGSQGGVAAQHLYWHLLESNVNSTKSMIFHYRPVSFKTETQSCQWC